MTKKKYKATFYGTMGSHWEDHPPITADSTMRDIHFPVGGTPSSVTVYFESKKENRWKKALKALNKKLHGESFHYWDWNISEEKSNDTD